MTDWLMVIITAVYVVATIAICVANFKSAKASKEQLEESKRQFEEQKSQYENSIRIQCMPFLQMETRKGVLDDGDLTLELPLNRSDQSETVFYFFKLKNLGNGPAINLVYTIECDRNFDWEPMPICGIRSGDEYIIQIEFNIDKETELLKPIIIFSYNDALGNEYSQRVTLVMDLENGTIICENDEPRL